MRMARAARSYRAARRNHARQLKQIWRRLDRIQDGDRSPVFVPIVLTQEEVEQERAGR